MKRLILGVVMASFLALCGLAFVPQVYAQAAPTRAPRRIGSPSPEATSSATPTASPSDTPAPTPEKRTDITQKSEESIGPLEKILASQPLGAPGPANAVKYAIRNAIRAGVPANTIVLLLLLPLVAAIIAAARHLIGLRGFGIFLPAALSIVFLAIGPVLGIALFLIIVLISTTVRMIIRRFRIKLQYLPRMAILLWFVVIGVLGLLFAAPLLQQPALSNVSIFPVLLLVLLAEDFNKVQLGKSINTAINLTTETLILSLVSYIFLTLQPIQAFALLNPEALLLGVLVFNFLIGRYMGLRLLELWRFRKLISGY